MDCVSCKRCDMGYVVANYVTPMMQFLTNDLKSFNMQMRTTKCLNTAIMMMFFFIGNKATKRAERCNASKVRDLYLQGTTNNMQMMNRLAQQVLRKSNTRSLFYILMNDGEMKHNGPQSVHTSYFPGHVFVIEKYPGDDGQNEYNVYQSYINQYDLKGYLQKSNNTFKYTYVKMVELMDNLKYILNHAPFWDQRCVEIWLKFTKVDSSNFLGAMHRDVLSICYTKDRMKRCLTNVERYARRKLREVNSMAPYDVYGDTSLYDDREKPMYVHEMKIHLSDVLADIKRLKNNVL